MNTPARTRHMMHDTPTPPRWRDWLAVKYQYILPAHTLSWLVHRLTRCRVTGFKNGLIRWFIRRYGVDLSTAQLDTPEAFVDFNHFFTRALKPGQRPVVEAPGEIACPVDGAVSQAGPIEGDTVFQAKGHHYSLQALFGGDEALAHRFAGGHFATLYLSPRDYHRIHMPLDGRLQQMVHIPGRLFSVNPATARTVPGLFARNERVVTVFGTTAGLMALVLVGAINVASIETVWAGEVTPPAGRRVRQWVYEDEEAITLDRGDEMGRFNMGSTVIVVFGPNAVTWDPAIRPTAPLRMGQRLGHYTV